MEQINIGSLPGAPRPVVSPTAIHQILVAITNRQPHLFIPSILDTPPPTLLLPAPQSPHQPRRDDRPPYIGRSQPCGATTRSIWRRKRRVLSTTRRLLIKSGLLLTRMEGSILAAMTPNSRRDLQFRLHKYSIWKLSTQRCYAYDDIPTSLWCPLILCGR
ncbi:uncharacterized protein [Triticum aestivum]|uniref:uncharacterized protein isoform X2 n=1 Tax=Triticum aestivum TaxID=4565 RepID=UPI001D00981A|nr:uncharacterized protein LOC123184345 isoform X2 [Triticum aestivum]